MDEQTHNIVGILFLLEKLRVSKTTIMLWRNDATNSQAQGDGIIKQEFSRFAHNAFRFDQVVLAA